MAPSCGRYDDTLPFAGIPHAGTRRSCRCQDHDYRSRRAQDAIGDACEEGLLPGHLAGTAFIPGPYPGHLLASGLHFGRPYLVILGCIAVVIVLLWIPVLGDRLTGYLSAEAPKVAPKMFLLGLVLLVAGLVIGFGILEIVGGGLMGIVVLAVILDNY